MHVLLLYVYYFTYVICRDVRLMHLQICYDKAHRYAVVTLRCQFLGTFATLRSATVSYLVAVRLHKTTRLSPIGQFFMKFDI